MLLDPNNAGTTVNPLSLDALIAWLEKQPSDEKYDYCNIYSCLAAQYNASIDREYNPPGISMLWWEQLSDGKTDGISFDGQLEFIGSQARTFGEALKVAKKLS